MGQSQHLYLPEKVVTIEDVDAFMSDLRQSQHLYLPEKVVTPAAGFPIHGSRQVAAPVPSREGRDLQQP